MWLAATPAWIIWRWVPSPGSKSRPAPSQRRKQPLWFRVRVGTWEAVPNTTSSRTAGVCRPWVQAPRVCRLADVLEAVPQDTDQPHPEGHRRVPVPVNHTVQVGIDEAAEDSGGLPVHGIVVLLEQFPGRRDGIHLLTGVPITCVTLSERKAKAVYESFRHPDLFQARGGGHLRIFNPASVPDQPGN